MAWASVRFLYLYCNDLAAVRHFYTSLLQLEESFFDENEAVAYRCDRLQFTVFRTDQALPSPGGWSKQPGWHGGTVPAISWSVELEPKAFKEAWMKMKDEGGFVL